MRSDYVENGTDADLSVMPLRSQATQRHCCGIQVTTDGDLPETFLSWAFASFPTGCDYHEVSGGTDVASLVGGQGPQGEKV